jgi:BTB/POZ domain
LIDSKLRSNLINLHKCGKYADIKLQIGDTVIPAHKCILASRSLKFKMLFESQMLDSPSTIQKKIDDKIKPLILSSVESPLLKPTTEK